MCKPPPTLLAWLLLKVDSNIVPLDPGHSTAPALEVAMLLIKEELTNLPFGPSQKIAPPDLALLSVNLQLIMLPLAALPL